ncbi:hypothetical protein CIG75_14285 [Tumebacillus algifaecis]|uniref:Lysoplasmalogenase n=1 Tax=Tumebacillus algifaecis TaxID=1214604 RepID=A0A223D3N4_9BACL|nr:lysoplasmalogenase [Tumebacillus algifaecis]ASS76016.1 hypothetical protein CIG75_14285 [Tumebacillus algifaecis]
MLLLASAAIGSGLIDLLAIARGWTKARYLWKPLTVVVIIALALFGVDFGDVSERWLLAGLVFSLAGDVFLVLPSDRFLAGLVSFLIAHLCYIAAFTAQETAHPAVAALSESPIGVTIVLAMIGLLYLAILRRGVITSGGQGMFIAVACYTLVILIMVWRAVMTGDVWVLAGSVLFMISDCILAWNRFLKSSLLAELAVMVTYYAAQLLLALSVF